mmetsp:Transcript_18555/g.51610  ORF Transcript_18555/g.51610 Transcript_18555/m.51610 type:complete len:219 (-) Transcript_18555:473-1129(-)
MLLSALLVHININYHAFMHLSTNQSPLDLSRLRLLVLLGLHVRFDVELGKQEEQRQDVDDVGGADAQGGLIALRHDEVGALRHHRHELHHLHHGEVGLPPDGKGLARRLVLRVHADEVVGVHDGVDEAVQDDGEEDVTVVEDVGIEPVEEEDRGVVVDVEEGQLSPLLAQHDEDGVPEIPHLRDVEQPKEVADGRVMLVVRLARKDGVVVAVREEASL